MSVKDMEEPVAWRWPATGSTLTARYSTGLVERVVDETVNRGEE